MSLRHLAIKAANELELRRAGRVTSGQSIDALAKALRKVAAGEPIEPSYFGPFSRLYSEHESHEPSSLNQVQEFVRHKSKMLDALDNAGAHAANTPELIRFCISLHKELVAEAEEALGYNERRSNRHASPSRVRAA